MTHTPSSGLTPQAIVRLLIKYRMRWMIPTILCFLLSVAYAFSMTRYWEASQALVVRPEVGGSAIHQPGKFADLYEMRTLQETILELAKSRQVIVETIANVDQSEGLLDRDPTKQQIDQFRKRLKMLPPNGAEFGRTEVFYFSMRDTSGSRAIRLVKQLCHELNHRLGELRDRRAQGVITELEQQLALSSETHQIQSQHLVEHEKSLGSDLGELRMLHSGNVGQSDLRQQLVQLESESRSAKIRLQQAEQLLALLQAAQKDTKRLVAMPSTLLVSHPNLSRFKDGLVDTQLRTAILLGNRSQEHPQVRAAMASVAKIREDLHDELRTAVEAAQLELQLEDQRYKAAEGELQGIETRLNRMAEQRVEYSNRIAAVSGSREVLEEVRERLNEVRAARAASHSAILVSQIDEPETGLYPVGPGRTTIVAAGSLGGFILGLGGLFLTINPNLPQPTGHGATPHAQRESPMDVSVSEPLEVVHGRTRGEAETGPVEPGVESRPVTEPPNEEVPFKNLPASKDSADEDAPWEAPVREERVAVVLDGSRERAPVEDVVAQMPELDNAPVDQEEDGPPQSRYEGMSMSEALENIASQELAVH